MRAVSLLLALATGCAVVLAAETPTAVVQTTTGPIQGYYNDKSGINIFKGVPYAAPPMGDLRFAAPQPPQPWTAVKNTSTFAPGCMALCPPVGFPKPEMMCTPHVSEDCLYLNVYAPAKPSEPLVKRANRNADNGMPVVFFIHGGNFMYGSGGVPLYDGQQMARTQHVIVVTINYRLNVFGGLYTGAGQVEGNLMLKDQILAMKWVRDNIQAFGGDPTKVTISGQSAGAASVAAHLTLPAAAGLFSGAIIVSNPASLLLANPTDAMELGARVLQNISCPTSGGVAELDCLRHQVSADTLLAASKVDYAFNPKAILDVMMQWVPVVDGDFVPQQPLDAFRKGNVSRVPVFFGTVANESVEFIFKLDEKPMSALDMDALLSLIFGVDLAVKVREVYGPVPESMKKDVRPYLEVLATDFIFYCPNRMIGGQLSKIVPTFMWLYDYLAYDLEWVFGKSMPFCVHNVCHAEDLAMIFFPYQWVPLEPGEPYPPPQREFDLSAIMQTSWGNFAYNGSPDPIADGQPASAIVNGTTYPQFNATQNVLVNLSVPVSNLVGYRNSVCDFWDTVGYRQRR
eukprot:CAMPEP_0174831824 /NCGR_PEP_ID=MMETSP1114-20130205/3328_1 /TAXON_ID=312471 /ORGANISM="Neobodo designis, Strain CCAP 1951/1" /LENGTH=569 /DNA_ID=CAMNT_0016065669 /DNA_START=34 /DNA_END=1743 /DNA_ORIENTATION=-